jgi:hypothetical protein
MAIAMTAAIPNAATLVKRPATNASEPANSVQLLPGNQTKQGLHLLGEDTHFAAKAVAAKPAQNLLDSFEIWLVVRRSVRPCRRL